MKVLYQICSRHLVERMKHLGERVADSSFESNHFNELIHKTVRSRIPMKRSKRFSLTHSIDNRLFQSFLIHNEQRKGQVSELLIKSFDTRFSESVKI